MKTIAILGTRGIPAEHGGFETFAERLSLYLASKGWGVSVYCQRSGRGSSWEDEWQGVRRVNISTTKSGASGTIDFDWKSVIHCANAKPRVVLTLGYNTALFTAWLRVRGLKNIINMDGLEWKRQKWQAHQRAWLWVNERAGCLLGHRLIADHPCIAEHLGALVRCSKIEMIPYGSDVIVTADSTILESYGLRPFEYSCLIARPEPENSVLELVRSFSIRRRDHRLVVLGNYDKSNRYHQRVMNAASEEVIFPGAIYDRNTISALRFFSSLYLHGHQVGGTNPSLVEALGAGNAIVAHDNVFNRWVAGDAAFYFSDEEECVECFDRLLRNQTVSEEMREAARARHASVFTWGKVLSQYESLLEGALQ